MRTPHRFLLFPFILLRYLIPIRVRARVRLTFYRLLQKLAGAPGARMLANPHEAFIAFLSFLVAVQFFLSPTNLDNSAVGRELPPWDWIWNSGLALGALLILVGLYRGRANVEVAGLMFHSGAILVQAVAVVAIFGIARAVFSLGIYVAAVVANLARAWVVVRYRTAVVIEDPT